MKGEYPASPGTSVIITDGTKNTTCYSFDKGEHGWCQVSSLSSKTILKCNFSNFSFFFCKVSKIMFLNYYVFSLKLSV